MRTTLTLDDDVAALLKRVVSKRKARFKDTVNEALRRGLDVLSKSAENRTPYRVRPWNLGGSRVGSLDNVEEVLSRAEGEAHK
jgi:hypothetical protein